MIVRVIDVQVKPESAVAFREATARNREGSIHEPGVLRFDLLQDEKDPAHFLLLEVYRDEAATGAHKDTAHYQRWRQEVEPMMARPRAGTSWRPLAPTDPSEW
jgi:autoinducer 2-degrading protein